MSEAIKRATDQHKVMTVISAPKPEPRKKKQANPPIDKQEYYNHRSDRGWGLSCDSGTMTLGHDMHHCFIGRKKGYPILDDYRNIVLVNHWLHEERTFDTREWRIYFWNLQCRRYGVASMMEWVNSLPEKMRSRIDWL